MKVAIITDQHFGARNDSIAFLDFFEKFYDNTFFPTLDESGIDTVLILGDTFDRRKYINFFTYKRAREMFFDRLHNRGIKVKMLAGNHDTYFKNTNEVNSIRLLLQEYDNIQVIDSPSTINLNDTNICMMPWICPENYDDSMETLKDSDAKYCMGHFEIAGFAMHRGMPSHEGLDRGLFTKFYSTFSGHYHHRSSSDDIHYLGNPYEMYWTDVNDTRGFHIFDTHTRELEFIQNPNRMFYKLNYDDELEHFAEQYRTFDYSIYEGCYVKVVVKNKLNPFLFDVVIDNLYKAGAADISVVEDVVELTGIAEQYSRNRPWVIGCCQCCVKTKCTVRTYQQA